ncbi:MAG: cupin domain-containing protein [Candidatus Omnitrophica bacterium]|nr:cupin domain-containing protein [Candidatus Omnitrophota bacterium]MDD5487681.1 cupin domain-containing protein [Candidatus Omnitrophota bacterium]
MEPARVFSLSDMVSFGESSIVSRVIAKEPAGNVTMFAFDKGEGLSEHTAPFNAIVYVLEGKAAVTISGGEHQVSSGEAIIIPAGEPHALKAMDRFKMLLIMIKG